MRKCRKRVSDFFTKPLLFTVHLRPRPNRGTQKLFNPSRRFLRFRDFPGSGNQKWQKPIRGVTQNEGPRKPEKCENGRWIWGFRPPRPRIPYVLFPRIPYLGVRGGVIFHLSLPQTPSLSITSTSTHASSRLHGAETFRK